MEGIGGGWEPLVSPSQTAVPEAELIRVSEALEEGSAAGPLRVAPVGIESGEQGAPAAGWLAAVTAAQPGVRLTRDAPVATLVPEGPLAVVARFGPLAGAAVRPGERARVWLAGWRGGAGCCCHACHLLLRSRAFGVWNHQRCLIEERLGAETQEVGYALRFVPGKIDMPDIAVGRHPAQQHAKGACP